DNGRATPGCAVERFQRSSGPTDGESARGGSGRRLMACVASLPSFSSVHDPSALCILEQKETKSAKNAPGKILEICVICGCFIYPQIVQISADFIIGPRAQ